MWLLDFWAGQCNDGERRWGVEEATVTSWGGCCCCCCSFKSGVKELAIAQGSVTDNIRDGRRFLLCFTQSTDIKLRKERKLCVMPSSQHRVEQQLPGQKWIESKYHSAILWPAPHSQWPSLHSSLWRTFIMYFIQHSHVSTYIVDTVLPQIYMNQNDLQLCSIHV